MTYPETTRQLRNYRHQIVELRAEMRSLQAAIQPAEVEDYEFSTLHGTVRLSGLFGDHDTLILIHNMGAACVYCTLWADGFNGLVDHLENRSGFVVASPDAPEAQQKFREGRGWRFKMVSCPDTNFADDMGYYAHEGSERGWQPGVSVFRKDGARIVRVSDANLGPGDDFCTAWHLFDLIPEGADGWAPKYKYSD